MSNDGSYSILGKNGIAIIIDNRKPESCGLQMEHHRSLEHVDESSCLLDLRTEESSDNENLKSFFNTTFGFLVMSFNNLTPEAIDGLLSGVMKAANCFDIRAFALVVLSNRKQKIPTQKILDRFSGPDVTDKPKMFVFQTILARDRIVQNLSLPPNSVVLTAYSQNTDQIRELSTLIMQSRCCNEQLKRDILCRFRGDRFELQRNLDTFFVLPNLQSDQNE